MTDKEKYQEIMKHLLAAESLLKLLPHKDFGDDLIDLDEMISELDGKRDFF